MSYLSYSVVKEPTSAKGGKSARPPRPCQAKYLLLPEEIAFDSEGPFRMEKNVLPRDGYNFREDKIISNVLQRTGLLLGTQHNAPPATPIPPFLHKSLCSLRLAPRTANLEPGV